MRLASRAWRRWLRLAENLGNIQMFIILTLMYWAFVPLLTMPFKYFSDPLGLSRHRAPSWTARRGTFENMDSMKKQS